MEEWRAVEGFPGYEVSSLGRMRSFKRGHTGKIMAPSRGRKSERAVITLYLDAKPHYLLVARLVCAAFRGPPPSPTHHAAHLDDDVQNDRASNIDWLTPQQNLSTRKMPSGGNQYSATMTNEEAAAIRRAYTAAKDAGNTRGVVAGLSEKHNVSLWVVEAIAYGRTFKNI
jgi:hypothetical protein